MPSLVERYRRGAEALGARGTAGLDEALELYDETLRFVDPVRELVGREALRALLEARLARGRTLRLDVVDGVGEGDVAFCSWVLSCELRRGPRLVVHGASHLRAQRGRVVFRRDYWDLGSTLAESVPLLGAAYRRAAARWP